MKMFCGDSGTKLWRSMGYIRFASPFSYIQHFQIQMIQVLQRLESYFLYENKVIVSNVTKQIQWSVRTYFSSGGTYEGSSWEEACHILGAGIAVQKSGLTGSQVCRAFILQSSELVWSYWCNKEEGYKFHQWSNRGSHLGTFDKEGRQVVCCYWDSSQD